MKRFIHLLLAVALAVICTGCRQKIGDINIFQYQIRSITPAPSLKGVDGVVALEVRNNGPKVTISSITGTVRHNGADFVAFSTGGFDLPARTTTWIELGGSALLCEGVSLLNVLPLVKGFDASKFSISFVADVKMGALKMKLQKKDVPLDKMITK